MKYVARTNTSVFPYGLIARGEALEEKHIRALGEAALAELVARGVIEAVEGSAPPPQAIPLPAEAGRQETAGTSSVSAFGAATFPNGGRLLEDEEDGEELTDLDGLDELAGEEPEKDAAPSKAKKPAAKRAGGRKAK